MKNKKNIGQLSFLIAVVTISAFLFLATTVTNDDVYASDNTEAMAGLCVGCVGCSIMTPIICTSTCFACAYDVCIYNITCGNCNDGCGCQDCLNSCGNSCLDCLNSCENCVSCGCD